MHRRFQTVSAASRLLLAVCACHPADNDTPEEAAEARDQALAARQVRLVQPLVRQERPTLELVGELRAVDTVTISAELPGRVDRVLIEVGDRVGEDEALVEVDRETYRLQLNQAEADLAAAEADLVLASKNLERKKDLLSDGTVAEAVHDQALATRDLAAARVGATQAARDLAQRNFERSVIRAPASGVVAARHSAAGQWADVGQALLDLAVGSQIKVAARVPSSWAPRLAGLDGFEFTVGGESQSRRARLYSIDPVVEGSSRSFEVVGTAPNSDGSLRPGMFANVRLKAPEPVESLWLPVTAVVFSDLPQVLYANDGKVVQRDVQTGRRDAELIEVVAGIDPEDAVIAEVAGLSRGMPVDVVGE
jgi:RND family efflux transporter MFP subunit